MDLAGPIVYGPVPSTKGFVSPTTSRPGWATCPRCRGSRRTSVAHAGSPRPVRRRVRRRQRVAASHPRARPRDHVRPDGVLCLGRVLLGSGLGARRGGAARELRDVRADGHAYPPLDGCGPPGRAVFGQGRVEEAQRLSVESEELGASDDLFNEMSWMRLRAKVAAAHDEPDQARALAKRARRGRRGCRLPRRGRPGVARPRRNPHGRGRPGSSTRRDRGARSVRAQGQPGRRALGTRAPRPDPERPVAPTARPSSWRRTRFRGGSAHVPGSSEARRNGR